MPWPPKHTALETEYAMQYGAAATEADVASVRKSTHDGVLSQCVFYRRLGPVQWVEFRGTEGADALEAAAKVRDVKLDQFIAANPGCIVVVALQEYLP